MEGMVLCWSGLAILIGSLVVIANLADKQKKDGSVSQTSGARERVEPYLSFGKAEKRTAQPAKAEEPTRERQSRPNDAGNLVTPAVVGVAAATAGATAFAAPVGLMPGMGSEMSTARCLEEDDLFYDSYMTHAASGLVSAGSTPDIPSNPFVDFTHPEAPIFHPAFESLECNIHHDHFNFSGGSGFGHEFDSGFGHDLGGGFSNDFGGSAMDFGSSGIVNGF